MTGAALPGGMQCRKTPFVGLTASQWGSRGPRVFPGSSSPEVGPWK